MTGVCSPLFEFSFSHRFSIQLSLTGSLSVKEKGLSLMLVITYLSLWYVTLQPVEEALRALVEAEVTSLFTEIFVKNL